MITIAIEITVITMDESSRISSDLFLQHASLHVGVWNEIAVMKRGVASCVVMIVRREEGRQEGRRQTKDGTLRASFRSDKDLDSRLAKGVVALCPVDDDQRSVDQR